VTLGGALIISSLEIPAMKLSFRQIIAVTTMLVVALVLAVAAQRRLDPPPQHVPGDTSLFDALIGMSEDEARQLLGEPDTFYQISNDFPDLPVTTYWHWNKIGHNRKATLDLYFRNGRVARIVVQD
jgi:hypothetical protein